MTRRALGLAALAAAAFTFVAFAPLAAAAPSVNGLAHRNVRVCDAARLGDAACQAIRHDTVPPNGRVTPNVGPAGYVPSDLQSAYNLPSAAGSGQTVAIVDAYDDPRAESDLGVYRSQFRLSPCTTANGCFRKVNQSGGTRYPRANSGWAQEIFCGPGHGLGRVPKFARSCWWRPAPPH